MSQEILGIHHVTAIANQPQKNLNFYAGFLGLRLVKLTVNFDDPQTYHLYYGDELGRPGTILTFFAWPDAPKGRQGTGQVTIVSFSIPQESLGYWIERCINYGVRFEGPQERFGESTLTFKDPDGLLLELVGEEKVGRNWTAFYKDPATPTDNLKRRLSNFYRFHATAKEDRHPMQIAVRLLRG